MATKTAAAKTATKTKAEQAATPAADEVRVKVRILKTGTTAEGLKFAEGATPRLKKSNAEFLKSEGLAEIIGV